MLKVQEAVKFESDATSALTDLFDRIPITWIEGVRTHVRQGESEIDAIYDLRVGEQPFQLVCEFKTNGHVLSARRAIDQLKRSGRGAKTEALMFVAPYISEPARAACTDAGVNYFDLYGNFRIFMGSLFVEASVADKPAVEKRDLRSLFKPKSSRVLRWLLRHPGAPMRLKEIAEGAHVSLGQVHNVKEGLLAREWATATPDGVVLTDGDNLVDAWRQEYEAPPHKTRFYYTVLHGDALIDKLKGLMAPDKREPVLALGSYSAANWLAPYARTETTILYAWPEALPALEAALGLEPAAKGANVVVKVLDEETVLRDAVEVVDDLMVTSPIQTYLDLYASGDRGREAAEFLRHGGFGWPR